MLWLSVRFYRLFLLIKGIDYIDIYNNMSSYKGKNPGGVTNRSQMNKSKRSVPGSVSESQSRMRKTMYGSVASRAQGVPAPPKKVAIYAPPPVQVIDEETGQDVTPQPLLQLDQAVSRAHGQTTAGITDGSVTTVGGGTPTDLMSQASIYQTGTVNQSTFGGGPFTRSVFSASQSGLSGSITDDLIEASPDNGSSWADIKHRHEDVPEELTEADLDSFISIDLEETETMFLFDLPSVCVFADSEEAQTVLQQNERYQELVKSRVGNDRYAERGMNTFNDLPKSKSVQTTKISYNEVGIVATTFDMYDTYEEEAEKKRKAEAAEAEKEEDVGQDNTITQTADPAQTEEDEVTQTPSITVQDTNSTQSKKTKSGLESQATMSSMAGGDSVFASKESGVTATTQDVEPDNAQEILQSDAFKWSLVVMERAVNQNNYQPKQACYRGFPIMLDIDAIKEDDEDKPTVTPGPLDEVGPNLDRLWAYQCSHTKNLNVSCIAWNRLNPDLLAVGYGQFQFTEQKKGLICCWSLKNPEFPERIFVCNQGVTSMDFSMAHPNLLAVGHYDGTVTIYNVRHNLSSPILDSFKDCRAQEYETSGKHTGPVWQLKWIEKERGSGEEKTEVLVSVSTDGRVTQWSIRKGFESYDLMKLKRVSTKSTGKKKAEAFISKFAGGLCFDFSSRDGNVYLVGTEEGMIHKCSCSYNEQYLNNYSSHTGPIYGIQWSPFIPDVFLSCGADWMMKLWHQDYTEPVLTFHSSTNAVHDICWSPKSSTVFACVNEGAVEVWDLSLNILDPIFKSAPSPGVKLSTVTFSKNSDCLLVGDSEGQVSVYQLNGMPPEPETEKQQIKVLDKIIQSSLTSQIKSK